MLNKPINVKDKTYCTQYVCKNNNCGCCKVEKPRISDFGNNIWGCGDERYNNPQQITNEEIYKLKEITVQQFAQELEHSLNNDLISEEMSIVEFIKILSYENLK